MITMHSPSYAVADDKEFENIKNQYLDRNRKLSLIASVVVCAGQPVSLTVRDELARIWKQ